MSEAKNKKQKKTSQFGEVCRRLFQNPTAMIGFALFSLIILACILAPYFWPYDAYTMDFDNLFAHPSLEHPFGTDSLGRDLVARMLYGGRYSISLGVIVSLVHAAFGLFFGIMIGYAGGRVDMIVMRIIDVVAAIPGQLLTIVLATVMDTGYLSLLIAYTVSGLPAGVRGPRAMALKESNLEYLEAAQSINASRFRIMYKHMLPNIIAPTIITTTMGIGGCIMGVAGLAYIGLGISPPTPEWGSIISEGRSFILIHPHMIMLPGCVIALFVLSINLFGDGLRDALDPKLKS